MPSAWQAAVLEPRNGCARSDAWCIIGFMSAQEMLIEEIKRQPEPVLREVLHYLKFLERQREQEAPMDKLVADTWEKLGPPPEVDYNKL